MSDEEDEYEYEYDEDDEEMGNDANKNDASGGDGDGEAFEYTDEEEEADDGAVALENAYYQAKAARDTSVTEAEQAFRHVIALEQQQNNHGDYGPWSFKALKQLVKLHLRRFHAVSDNNDSANMMSVVETIMRDYHQLLACSVKVSPNAAEKGMQGMLERVTATLYHDMHDASQALALAVYDATLQVVQPATSSTTTLSSNSNAAAVSSPNERLWFKTNLKYGQLLYEMNETAKLQQVLRDLQAYQAASDSGGGVGSSSSSSSAALEIYALQLQLYDRLHEHKKLRQTYQDALTHMRGSLPHPRTLALIQELGGKNHMAHGEYAAAEKVFFQAFKSYDEAGDSARLKCLKYLVLASMLSQSSINPFDSQEARPYRDDAEIVAMTALVSSFQSNDIVTFEHTLSTHAARLKDDFIQRHVQDLRRTIRLQVLQSLLRPYSTVQLASLARQLNNVDVHIVEGLLVDLITRGDVHGSIDKMTNVLHVHAKDNLSSAASAAASVRPPPQQQLIALLSDLNTALAQTKVKESENAASSSAGSSGGAMAFRSRPPRGGTGPLGGGGLDAFWGHAMAS